MSDGPNRREVLAGGLSATMLPGCVGSGHAPLRTPQSLGIVPSRFIRSRRVDVWLPEVAVGAGRLPVIYAHDGQNLFSDALAFGGRSWRLGECMGRLIRRGAIRPALVVAIWNTQERAAEYMPEAPIRTRRVDLNVAGATLDRSEIRSDRYLRFVVEELKPTIDRRYPTLPEARDTFVMGSSMGGLISAYALARHPDVFGGAACLSTHWPAGDGVCVDWFARNLPRADTRHRIYWDHGTATLDASYARYQRRMDEGMAALGYTRGRDWRTVVVPGAEHSERAWAARVDVPLGFLLGACPDEAANGRAEAPLYRIAAR